MGYEYLVLSALANALALSILSSYFYAEKYMKWKKLPLGRKCGLKEGLLSRSQLTLTPLPF